MAQQVLANVLLEIEALQPAELQEVNRAVTARLKAASKELEREAALRVLEDTGLVRQVKRPPMIAGQRRRPVPITGKPLSETIVEDRK